MSTIRLVRLIALYVLAVSPAVLLSFLLFVSFSYLPMIKDLSLEDASSPALGIFLLSYIRPSIWIGLVGAIPLTLLTESLLNRFFRELKNEHLSMSGKSI
jgi:hypothetical protein